MTEIPDEVYLEAAIEAAERGGKVMGLFDTGIRPAIDKHLLELSQQRRDYGEYWSASSAGYCMRKNIFERMGVPHVETEADARKQRVLTSGHIFHDWIQEITKKTGLSIAQEIELQDEELMIRGHIDDLIKTEDGLILYDYKTQNSRAFSYKRPNMSHYHKMQLGTYLYMLRTGGRFVGPTPDNKNLINLDFKGLSEARILKISKDDLRMGEEQLLWTPELEREVVGYWTTLNGYWKKKTLPKCTCADYEGGFMARDKFNPFFYGGEPCSIEWYNKWKGEQGEAVKV